MTRIAIIGCGISGIAAAKQLSSRGFTPTIFEKDASFGGTWSFHNPKSYDNLECNSSSILFRFSEMHYPDEVAKFPSLTDVVHYLTEYVRVFNLEQFMRFNSEVIRVRRAGDVWNVTVAVDGLLQVHDFDYVVVATGYFCHPVTPKFHGIEEFGGEVIHSSAFRREERFVGKKVMCIGTGNSGLDIGFLISEYAEKVIIACKSVRALVYREDDNGVPTDQLLFDISNMDKSEKKSLFESVTVVPLFRRHLPSQPFKLANAIIKNKKMFNQRLEEGKLVLKGNPVVFKERSAIFEDGCEEEIDTVIIATGYNERKFHFLDPELVPKVEGLKTLGLYKNIVHPEHPSLFFVDMLESLGSSLGVAEIQSRYITEVIAGGITLPSTSDMAQAVEDHMIHLRAKNLPVPAFVDYCTYVTDLEKDLPYDYNFRPKL